MLFLLFTDEQLRAIFDWLGYELAPTSGGDVRLLRRAHVARLHASHVAHAGVLAAIDPERSGSAS